MYTMRNAWTACNLIPGTNRQNSTIRINLCSNSSCAGVMLDLVEAAGEGREDEEQASGLWQTRIEDYVAWCSNS